MLKLISEKYTVCYQSVVNPAYLVSFRTSTVTLPSGETNNIILGFSSPMSGEVIKLDLIGALLERGFVVVLVTDRPPKPELLHKNLIYIVADWKWLTHTLFFDYHQFSGVFYCGKESEVLAKNFKIISPYSIPIFTEISKCPQFITAVTEVKEPTTKRFLLDSVTACGQRGLGDILMTTVGAKYLSEHGWVVDYYVRDPAGEVLKNNPYIDKVYLEDSYYTDNSRPDKRKYTGTLLLSRLLEEYKDTRRNQQSRIKSILELLRIDPSNLTDFTPVLVLTEEEKKYGQQVVSKVLPNLVLGLESSGSKARSYPHKYRKELLTLLSSVFNVIVIGVTHKAEDFTGVRVTDLRGKTKLREAISIIAASQIVLTMDTAPYWFATALGVPSVVLFTTIHSDWRVSEFEGLVRPINANLSCAPCWDRELVRDPEAFLRCKRAYSYGGEVPCSFSFTPGMVFDTVTGFSRERGIL